MIFGLGASTAVIAQVQVTWPDGITTAHTGPGGGGFAPGAVHRLVDTRSASTTSSLGFTYQAHPGGGADWIFTWTTPYHTDVFKHRLVWSDRCCYPAPGKPFRFRVYSGFAEPQGTDFSSWKTYGTSICLQ